VSNSFKLYRAELIKEMRLDCKHFDIVEEILVKCALQRKELRIQEVPFVFKTRMFGTTKRDLFVFILTFAVTLFRLLTIRFKAGWRQ
jgi:dolichol-phosphate mannosyltransferase